MDPLDPTISPPFERNLPSVVDSSNPLAGTAAQAPAQNVRLVRPTVSTRLVPIPAAAIPAGSADAVRLCQANPNRVSVIIRGRTAAGSVYIGGPDAALPSGGLNRGVLLEGKEVLTLDCTGELWAISSQNGLTSGQNFSLAELVSEVSQ